MSDHNLCSFDRKKCFKQIFSFVITIIISYIHVFNMNNKVLADLFSLLISLDQLRKLSWNGIPKELRGTAWRLLSVCKYFT